MPDRVYNFAAGPAQLPEAVLKKAQAELLNWHGCGMSVMEMSHRGSQLSSSACAFLRTASGRCAGPAAKL